MRYKSHTLSIIRSHKQVYIHLLLLAALFQALLPMLLQPSMVQDSEGNTLVVCTLQGLQTIQTEDGSTSSASSNPCPACTLSHAGAAALLSAQPQLTQFLSFVAYPLPQYRVTVQNTPAYFKAPTRAPPVA